jgi:hypothetical protein
MRCGKVYFLVDISQSIQNLSKKPPESDSVAMQPLVNGVAECALFTVLHLQTRTNQAELDHITGLNEGG